MTKHFSKTIRAKLQEIMLDTHHLFTPDEVASALIRQEGAQWAWVALGMTPDKLLKQYLLAEAKSVADEFARPPEQGTPTLPGLPCYQEHQLIRLGDGRRIWVIDAQYEQIRIRLEQQRKNVAAAQEQYAREKAYVEDSGLLGYLKAHPFDTVRKAIKALKLDVAEKTGDV
jgi:hypothetical protein